MTDKDSLVVLTKLRPQSVFKESLKLSILEQSRLRGLGLSKFMRDSGVSQWSLPEKYGESLLKFPTPTSLVFSAKKANTSSSEKSKSIESCESQSESASQSASSSSENAELRFAYSKVERQGRRLAFQATFTAASSLPKKIPIPKENADDADVALVDIRGLPTKEGLRQALIARAGSLRRAYKVLDSGNAGKVSLAKFQSGLSQFGIDTFELLGKEPREVFMEFDDDNSGDLSLIELIGFYSQADEDLLRITADGFVPGQLLWTRYINQVNSQKTTLNRQPCWDPRRFKISQIQQLMDSYEHQREFERQMQELSRQLRESSTLNRQRLMATLDPAQQQASLGEEATAKQLTLHERVQRIAHLVRELGVRRKDMRQMIAEAAEVMAMKPTAPDVVQEVIGIFGVPVRDAESIRFFFDRYAGEDAKLAKEKFKKFTKHITLDEVVPARQYQDWWNFMTREKSTDFMHILIWYSHFIM